MECQKQWIYAPRFLFYAAYLPKSTAYRISVESLIYFFYNTVTKSEWPQEWMQITFLECSGIKAFFSGCRIIYTGGEFNAD